jgi:antitoxin VapB
MICHGRDSNPRGGRPSMASAVTMVRPVCRRQGCPRHQSPDNGSPALRLSGCLAVLPFCHSWYILVYIYKTAEDGPMPKKVNPQSTAQSTVQVGRAKLFKNGRSQAVRLPKAFRIQGEEVSVRREGDAVILEPIKKRDWPKGFWVRVDRRRRDLELGELPPMGGALLDISEDA